MPRLTKIYTRTGDDGTTGLGSGTRVAKTAPRVEAFGTVDELNACVGVVRTLSPAAELVQPLAAIQNELFHAGADLCIPEADKAAMPGPRIEPRHVEGLERLIDRLNAELPPLANFILPGGTPAAAALHAARAVCRRAERDAIRLAQVEPIGDQIVTYLNRLSDALFVMARYENLKAGIAEPVWDSRA